IVVQAEGEKEAAEKLAEAAQILNSQEGGFYVRLLRSIPEVVSQPGSVIAFPLPMELRHLLPQSGDEHGE
ncbi:MAG: slipin family protein, partial [Dethiobacteria bacterium]